MSNKMIKWTKELEKEFSDTVVSFVDTKDFIELINNYISNNEILFDKNSKVESISENALYDVKEYTTHCILEEYITASECETNRFLKAFNSAHIFDDEIKLSEQLISRKSYKGDFYNSGVILNDKEFIIDDEDFYSTIFNLIKTHPAISYWKIAKDIYAEYISSHSDYNETAKDFTKEEEISEGFVYIGKQLNEDNLYKIGSTKQLSKRLSTFKCGNCFIEFIMTKKVKNASRLERELHSIFRSKKYKREWFELNEEDFNLLLDLGFNYCLQQK